VCTGVEPLSVPGGSAPVHTTKLAAREIPVTRVRLCCPTEAPEMRRSLGATPRFARWRRPGAQACYPAVIRALCSPAAHRDKRTRPPYPLRSAGGRAPRQAPCR